MASRKSIRERDQKTLWGRAAGRCAMCREPLTLDEADGSGLTVGAMAHIVADSAEGPRGHSDLSEDERRAYGNLVLLCSHHHDIIDTQVAAHGVPRLHTIKAQHEAWVANALAAAPVVDPDPASIVYASIVDGIESALPFSRWRDLVDSLVRDQMPLWLVDSRGAMNELVLRAVWPDPDHPLAVCTREMVRAFSDYVVHFESHVEVRGPMLVADKTWKRQLTDHAERRAAADLQERWSAVGFCLLADWVVKLNGLCDAIRAHLNPVYRIEEGYFLIYDDLGVRGDGMTPTLWRPRAEEVRAMLNEARGL